MIKPSNIAARRTQVLKYLQRKLLTIQPGEALPPMRQMMAECGVSQLLISRGVDELKQAGLIESSSRRGLFKSQKTVLAHDLVRTVDVVYCRKPFMASEQSSYHGELLRELGRTIGERGQAMRMSFLGEEDPVQRAHEIADRSDCAACLLILSDRPELAETVFAPRHIPVVNLLPRSQELPPYSIIPNAKHDISLQIEHLLELGHRKIGYVHTMPEGTYHSTLAARREHFYRILSEHGLKCEPHWVCYGGFSTDDTLAVARKMFASENRPTAIIIPDHQLVPFYQVLAELNLTPGKEVSVVGMDDLEVARMVNPAATTLRTSRDAAGRIALNMLDKLIAGEETDRLLFTPSQLIIRASTGPVCL